MEPKLASDGGAARAAPAIHITALAPAAEAAARDLELSPSAFREASPNTARRVDAELAALRAWLDRLPPPMQKALLQRCSRLYTVALEARSHDPLTALGDH